MLFADLQKKLIDEFNKVKLEKNPKVTQDIEAVVVLSGESRDPAVKTDLHDTEERLAEGIRIYKKIQELGGSTTLILNGTDPQNIFMEKEARKKGIVKIITIKNPPFPIASTKTQILGIKNLQYKNVIIITHAYHGPRAFRYAIKYLDKNCEFRLFLLCRDKIEKKQLQEEIKKTE